MGVSTIHTEIRTKFITVWTDQTTIAFPNSEFNPPNLDTGEWCRLTIVDGEQRQLNIGAATNTFRDTGQIIVQVFTPLNTGETRGLVLGDTIADAFRNHSGTQLRCREAKVKGIGITDDGWNQTNVIISFLWDNLY